MKTEKTGNDDKIGGMTPKEYLEQVKTINRTVALMKEKLVSMRSILYVGAIDYSEIGGARDSFGINMEVSIAVVIDYETRLKKEIGRLISRRVQVEKSIAEVIGDPLVREIFERKYLLFHTWETISQDMCYSVQHLHRLHSKYLPKFAEIACKEL